MQHCDRCGAQANVLIAVMISALVGPATSLREVSRGGYWCRRCVLSEHSKTDADFETCVRETSEA